MAQTYDTLYERELAKLIEARVELLKEEMAPGTLSKKEYQRRGGMIDAFRAVLVDMMPQAEEASKQANR